MELKIIEPIGLCNSASSILDEIEKNIDKYNNIYILGEILHNEYVINYLSNMGIKFVKKIDDIPKCKYNLVVLPAHGTSPKVYEKLSKYNFIDLTCPKIRRMHKMITDNIDKDIIFVGKKNHSETLAFKDYKNVHVVHSVNDVEKAKGLSNPILMCQTTFGIDDFNEITDKLKEIYPSLVIIDTLCNIPIDRIRNIDKTECDLLLVIGSTTSSNANEIKNSKSNSMIVSKPEDINIEELKKYKTVAIASASSTPIQQVNEILDYIRKAI